MGEKGMMKNCHEVYTSMIIFQLWTLVACGFYRGTEDQLMKKQQINVSAK